MNGLAGRLMRPGGRLPFALVRSLDVGQGVEDAEEEVRGELDSIKRVESGDESLELELVSMLMVEDAGLPRGLSNDEEPLLAGDSDGMVDAGDANDA
jgi:hypothetical protein